MAVKITEQMYDTFTNNGYTEDDIQNTVNHYREQGMPDSAIFTNMNKKHRELAGIKDFDTPQIGDQPSYNAILNDPSLTPQQQAEQIKQTGEAYRTGLDKDLMGQKVKMWGGGLIKMASPAAGLVLAPVTGGLSLPASMAVTGLAEGATFGLGEALQNQKKGTDFAKEVAAQGLLGGALGAGTGALFKYAAPALQSGIRNINPRYRSVMQRRNIPLSERYISPEELQKYINADEPKPSSFGVNAIDTQANQQIAKQIEQNILAEKELYKEYRNVHSNLVKKYGSIENLRNQAIADMPQNTQYGVKTDAIKDYRDIIAYEKSLADAKYINNKILPSATRQGVTKLSKENIPTIGEAPIQQISPKKFAIEADTNVEIQPKINAVEQPQVNVPEMVQPEIPTQDVNVSQIPTTTKQTKLSESIQKAKGLPRDIKKAVKDNVQTYESMTNEALKNTVSKDLDANFEYHVAEILGKKKFDSAYDVERARQITQRLGKQKTDAANELMLTVIEKAQPEGSRLGQSVQAFRLWGNLTPEGALLKTQKLINEYNKRFGKNLKLNNEQLNTIMDLQAKAQALPDGYNKDVALAQSLKYQQSLIPKSLGAKLKAYRNISLLLNLKTLGRNVVGNALFNTLDTASKTLAVPIDRVMSAFTKTHTRALPQVGESLKGLKLGAERGFKEAMQGINTADVSSRYDLQGGKVFESKVGQAFETALDLGLRVPDRAFYNSVYAESLANQLKASGLKEPTTKMIEQAEKEALEGVFQNKSALSDIALGLRKQFNRVGTKEFGLGDLLIPYAQTPANLAQQGINYSPLGLLKAGASLKGGNQRQASLDIARALVGTGIGAAGYGAVKSGQATGSLETGKGFQQDLRLKKNLELLGVRPQQVGDISYSQFQPASIPFAVGAATATGESPTQAGLNTLLDLPFLQNYNKIMSDIKQDGIAQAGANFAASIPSQFVPTALGQVNQAFDNTVRETYSPNKLQQGLNVAGAKIPFVAQTLPARVNVKGEPVQRYESTGITRLGDIFLNPTFINKKKNDVVIKEMNNLYRETGEASPLLPVAQRTIKVNGEQKKLTGKEVNKYQKEVGKISYYLRKKALESDTFKSMNSDEKIDYLSKMNKGVTQAVKVMMFNDSPKKIQPFAQEILDNYDTFTK